MKKIKYLCHHKDKDDKECTRLCKEPHERNARRCNKHLHEMHPFEALRRIHRLGQMDLSRLLQISQSNISKIENGEIAQDFELKTLAKIRYLFQIDMNVFVFHKYSKIANYKAVANVIDTFYLKTT